MVHKEILQTGMINIEHCLELIALAIGTSKKHKTIEDHYLYYLAKRITGQNPLNLDKQNQEICNRLKKILEDEKIWL